MVDLDGYIINNLPHNDGIVSEITTAVERVIELFDKIDFRADTICWDYRAVDQTSIFGRSDPPQQLSQSTTSMIVASLLRANGMTDLQASCGYPWSQSTHHSFEIKSAQLTTRIHDAITALSLAWDASGGGGPTTKSATYGLEDILTVSWHLDIFGQKDRGLRNERIVADCKRIVSGRADKFATATSSYLGICDAFQDKPKDSKQNSLVGDSSYILLRLVRALHACFPLLNETANIAVAAARASKRMQSRLHDHLSYAEITDSRFDPAELAYCLEGLLILRPTQVDDRLMNRALTVLERAQERSAYWRTDTPIVIQQRGHVLLPISVETARSIVNSISIFNDSCRQQTLIGRSGVSYERLEMLKRYWSWLKARQTALKINGHNVAGWHSEHVNDPGLIHTWETSQILEFLLSFRDLLQKQTAEELLTLSRLKVRMPEKFKQWSDIIKSYEPYTHSPNDVYRRIGEDFVNHHLVMGTSGKRDRPNWSMLLFGPPGTGKTTIADNLSDCLQIPVITVTVSDFLAEGEARMENKAKNIFNVLEHQVNSIVLFDEMDQFMLDRNSDLFKKQESVFQFLTPGMLTKVADLRKKSNTIFIIATNYEERIDAAIKRTGRIDQSYLVLPPDAGRRWSIMEKVATPLLKESTASKKKQLIEASCLLSFTDIKRVVSSAPKTFADLKKGLSEAPRSVQLKAMVERFSSICPGLIAETEGLIQLVDEAQSSLVTRPGSWSGSPDFVEMIRFAQSADERIKNTVSKLEAAKVPQ